MKYELAKEHLLWRMTAVAGAAALALTGCNIGYGETERRLNAIEECLDDQYDIEANLTTHPENGQIVIPRNILDETNACIQELNKQ